MAAQNITYERYTSAARFSAVTQLIRRSPTRLSRLLICVVAIALSSWMLARSAPAVGDKPAWIVFAFAPWLASLYGLKRWSAAASGFAMGLAYIVPGHWYTFQVVLSSAGLEGLLRELVILLFFSTYAVPFAVFAAINVWLQRRDFNPTLLALSQALILSSLIITTANLISPFPYTPVVAIANYAPALQMAALGGEPLLLTLLL